MLPAGAVSKPASKILPTDRVVGIDSRGADISGVRYWVLENAFAPEEVRG